MLSLQQELAEITADLNLAIEEAGLLQNVVSGLTSDLSLSQSQNAALQLELTSTQQELSDRYQYRCPTHMQDLLLFFSW